MTYPPPEPGFPPQQPPHQGPPVYPPQLPLHPGQAQSQPVYPPQQPLHPSQIHSQPVYPPQAPRYGPPPQPPRPSNNGRIIGWVVGVGLGVPVLLLVALRPDVVADIVKALLGVFGL